MNPFNPPKRLFKMLNKEFEFRFIPSIHFQEILRHVLEVLTIVEPGASLGEKPALNEAWLNTSKRLLEEKVYDILADVLQYQNGEKIALDILKHQTSPLEIASFVQLLLIDEEVVAALGLVADGLGKLTQALLAAPFLAPSPTTSSTPSS
jgi:hypothetical protein